MAPLWFPRLHNQEKYVDLKGEFPDSDSARLLYLRHVGIDFWQIPKEASQNHSLAGIDRQWVIDNWNKWIYETCNIDDVYVIQNYPIPVIDYSKP